MVKRYHIEVDCANCAAKMERACQQLPGIKALSISFMLQKMTVEFDDGANQADLLRQIEKTCKKVDRDFALKA